MDLRALKKRCKEAAEVLVSKHGYPRDSFTPADGRETLNAPADLEPRFVRGDWIEPGVLKGTLVHWARCSYEYDEWDCKLPTDILDEIEFWESVSEDDIRAMDEMAEAEPTTEAANV